MKITSGFRFTAVSVAVALSLAMCAVSVGWHVPAARAASGALDAQAIEFVRLFNGVRAVNGLPALMVDPYLASKARDGAIPCPDDNAETIAGRAQDMAASGVLSHDLRLCDSPTFALSGTLFLSVLQSAWAYENVGEIDLLNVGYGHGAYLYTYKGWQTWTYATTGNGMLGWQSSSSHWNIIVGSYDRVGCGGWESATFVYFYDCVFSVGGSSPSGLESPPTTPPFANPVPTLAPGSTPAATPTPTATPTLMPGPAATKAPGSGVGSSGSSTTTTPSRSSESPSVSEAAVSGPAVVVASGSGPVSAASPSPKSGFAAGSLVSGNIAPAGRTAALPILIVQEVALSVGSGATLLALCWLLLTLRRRRKPIISPAAP